jgi:Fur family zinc uptake transcriptional regulator
MLCYDIRQWQCYKVTTMALPHQISHPAVPVRRAPGRNQQLVLDALSQARKPLSAYDLLNLLRDDGLRSPLQIYRALERLIAIGSVHKIESTSTFAMCSHGNCGAQGHAVFAICTRCGETLELHDPELDHLLRDLSSRHGFSTRSTVVELSGLCQSCTREPAAN